MGSGCVVCIDNGHGANFQDNGGILLHKFIFINFVSNDRLRCVVVVQLYVAYWTNGKMMGWNGWYFVMVFVILIKSWFLCFNH